MSLGPRGGAAEVLSNTSSSAIERPPGSVSDTVRPLRAARLAFIVLRIIYVFIENVLILRIIIHRSLVRGRT